MHDRRSTSAGGRPRHRIGRRDRPPPPSCSSRSRAARPDVPVELVLPRRGVARAGRLRSTTARRRGRRAAAAVDRLPRAVRHPGRRRRPDRTRAVARHLGPHPLLDDALVDRLPSRRRRRGPTVLVGAGSSRPGRAADSSHWPAARPTGSAPPVDGAPADDLGDRDRGSAAPGAGRDLPAGRGRVRRHAAARPPTGRRGRSPTRSACTRRWSSWSGRATTRRRRGPVGSPGRRYPRRARPGSSVGTSDRLKSGRSAVRPRPWPPSDPPPLRR